MIMPELILGGFYSDILIAKMRKRANIAMSRAIQPSPKGDEHLIFKNFNVFW